MSLAKPIAWTVDDFLAYEAEEPDRYEFVGGIVRMMTGATAAHSAIKLNLALLLKAALGSGRCRVDADDLKVVTETAVMYPDVMVTCRPIAPDDSIVRDPTVVVEVLSPSTEKHDRIAKWREYQTIPELRHFLVVAQAERRIEIFSRTGEDWVFHKVEPPADVVRLTTLNVELSLEAIYADSGR